MQAVSSAPAAVSAPAASMSTTAVDAVHAQPAAVTAPKAVTTVPTATPPSAVLPTGAKASSSVVQAKALGDGQGGVKSPLGTVLEEHLLLNLLAKARR